jgi:hypothetical protein
MADHAMPFSVVASDLVLVIFSRELETTIDYLPDI